MSDIKTLIRRLRNGEHFQIDCAEAADLIEQQGARIAELEAGRPEPVCYAVSIELASAMAKERTSLDTCTKRGGAYDTPLYAAPVADSAMAKDAERWHKAREAFWPNGDPLDMVCNDESDAFIDSQIAASEPKNGE